MAPLAENMWAGVCRALERPELIEDPLCVTRVARNANKDYVRAELTKTFAENTSDHWIGKLQQNSVPSAKINSLDKVAEDPQVLHREMIVESSYEGHDLRLVGNPVKIDGVTQKYGSPPRLGEHTAAILREIGLNEGAIETFFSQNVAR